MIRPPALTRLLALPVALAALAACGCGSTPTGSVSGKVVYKGKPVPNAQVNFVPASGYPAAAVTNDSGEYSVSGVAYGPCKVTVYAIGTDGAGGPSPDAPPARNPNASPEEKMKARDQQVAKAKLNEKPKLILPAKYKDPGTTTLLHNVNSPSSTYEIELKD